MMMIVLSQFTPSSQIMTNLGFFFLSVPTEVAAPWTEDTVRQCLFLYLSLLPLNHRLVHELASVYTEAIADIKRSVLRAIEQPVSISSCILFYLNQPCNQSTSICTHIESLSNQREKNQLNPQKKQGRQ